MPLQMRPAVQVEPLRRLFAALLGQNPNRIDRQGADRQGPFNGPAQLGRLQRLQESQHPNELPATIGLQFPFQAPSEHAKAFGQLPVLQRASEVQGTRLSL